LEGGIVHEQIVNRVQQMLPSGVHDFLVFRVVDFGINLWHPALFYPLLILVIFLLSGALRTGWAFIARPLGLYDPSHYRLFPRIPWRFCISPLFILRRWVRERHMGRKQTAGWASPIDRLFLMFRSGDVFVGRLRLFGIGLIMPIGIRTRRHLVMIAGTGAGKTTSLIAMLALHRGNAFVIDPNGQIARAQMRRCGRGGKGIIGKRGRSLALDPKEQLGRPSACWNVFDELHVAETREGIDSVPELASVMAFALVQQDSQSQPFFSNASREFVTALILYIYAEQPREHQHAVRLRQLLTSGLEGGPTKVGNRVCSPFDYLLFKMNECTAFNGIIRDGIATVVNASSNPDKIGQLLSSARTQTVWLDLPRIRSISMRSDFTLNELKTDTLSLFLVAPVSDVQETLSPWFRLLTVFAQQTFERIPGRPKYPTLFALDEMPSLGYIKAFDNAAPVMRKYGVQLLAITQDIEKLRDAYPQTYGGFLGGADAVIWMGTNHGESLEFLESSLGGHTITEVHTSGRIPGFRRKEKSKSDRPLAYAEQLREFLDPAHGNVIVTRNGPRALKLKTPHYFKELPVWMYESDPDEHERALRAMTRRVCRAISMPFDDKLFSGRISRARAMEMFCLSDPYTRDEVEQQFSSFQPTAAKNSEFARVVKNARAVLLKGAVS
jgi:type IV secretory pathway TraG/TraD family ATPase VirD4